MTRTTTKRIEDEVGRMEGEGQGQQQATPPGEGRGVTVAPSTDAPTDDVTDQDVDTAAVGLEPDGERDRPKAKTPPAAQPQADGTPGEAPGGVDGPRTRGVLVAGE